MKIGFDAKRAFNNYSGLGNYSRSAIEALTQFYPDNHYYLFTTDNKTKLIENILLRKNVESVFSDSLIKILWRSFLQVNDWKKKKLDVYHGLSAELPYWLGRVKTKKVVTIHDVIYKSNPEYYSVVDRTIYDLKTKHACLHADQIICVSEQTRQAVIRFYKIPEKKIKVIYPALPIHISRTVTQTSVDEVKIKYNLPDKFILYTGTMEKRKNLLTVIKALNQLGESAPALIAVGRATAYLNEIKKYINTTTPNMKASFIHDAGNDELNIIYSLATIFIYTSLHEGFGIPLIEAGAHGIPSITTKDSCMEEAAGSGALTIDSKSVNETARAIEKLTNDTILYKHLSVMASSNAAQFKSKRLADELMNIYSSL